MRQRYIVAYDIANTKRRYHIERLLCEYGERIQYSIFEVVATPAQQRGLQRKLKRLMSATEDALNFYKLSDWAGKNSVLQGNAQWATTAGEIWCIG